MLTWFSNVFLQRWCNGKMQVRPHPNQLKLCILIRSKIGDYTVNKNSQYQFSLSRPLGSLFIVWTPARLGQLTELCKGNFKLHGLNEPTPYAGCWRRDYPLLRTKPRVAHYFHMEFPSWIWGSALKQLTPFYLPLEAKSCFWYENWDSYHWIMLIVHTTY